MRTLFTSLCCFCFILLSTVVDAKILFRSIAGGFTGLYVMEDDGSNIKLLIGKSVPGNPRWSPDGRQIVFGDYNFDIKVGPRGSYIAIMNADGTNIRQLTKTDNGTAIYPSFSPDGKQVLFSRHHIKRSISTLDLESGEIKEIAQVSAGSSNWSPDGRHIVYSTHPFGGATGANLWIMDADGKNARQLLPDPEDGQRIIRTRPRWSPDGKQILYEQSEYEVQQVGKIKVEIHLAHRYMICDRDGENIVELDVPKNWKPMGVDWMDDGESVVISMREIELNKLNFVELLEYHIYKYHLTTKNLTELTNPAVDGYEVDWIKGDALSVSPKGKKQTRWGEIKKVSSVFAN